MTKSMPQFNRPRARKLAPEEFEALLQALWSDEREAAKAALLTALLGGQRIAELERAEVAHFAQRTDPPTLTLIVKKGRNARPRPHMVPVLGPALPIVREFAASARAARREFLLPVSGDDMRDVVREISERFVAEAAARKETVAPFVLHDIRAACETQLVALGVVSKEIRGWLLAHGVHGVQDAHYDAHSYMPERTDALRRLQAWIMRVVENESGDGVGGHRSREKKAPRGHATTGSARRLLRPHDRPIAGRRLTVQWCQVPPHAAMSLGAAQSDVAAVERDDEKATHTAEQRTPDPRPARWFPTSCRPWRGRAPTRADPAVARSCSFVPRGWPG